MEVGLNIWRSKFAFMVCAHRLRIDKQGIPMGTTGVIFRCINWESWSFNLHCPLLWTAVGGHQ